MKNNNTVKVSVLESRFDSLSEQNTKEHQAMLNGLDEVKDKIDEKFVTVDQFAPVQKIVYGMVGTILVAFLYLVIQAIYSKGIF